MKYNKKILIILIIILIALVAFLVWAGLFSAQKTNPDLSANLTAFAQCLASKNITMYGAVWCSWCKKEKASFGNAFKYVPYVEGSENVEKCLNLGIEGYPTWIFSSDKRFIGYQGLEKLSKESNCLLVEE